jgi:LPS-assembly protein
MRLSQSDAWAACQARRQRGVRDAGSFQKRYFDPIFGGAVLPNQRNVVLSTVDLTADVSGPTAQLLSRGFDFPIEPAAWFLAWRADGFTTAAAQLVNSGLDNANYRRAKYFFSAATTRFTGNRAGFRARTRWVRSAVGWRTRNWRGWNTAFTAIYDCGGEGAAVRDGKPELQHGLKPRSAQ